MTTNIKQCPQCTRVAQNTMLTVLIFEVIIMFSMFDCDKIVVYGAYASDGIAH